MIDTMGFYIPISESDYSLLVSKAVETSRIDKSTGEAHFEYHNFETRIASHNHTIKWGLRESLYIYDDNISQPVLEKGFPHIRVEFSAPKVLYGHNLISISLSKAFDALFLVRESFMNTFGFEIPHLNGWYPYRIDVCANYIMNDISEVKNYISYLGMMEYPRRGKPFLYKDQTIYFKSRYATLKLYSKGDDFKEHDRKRILNESVANRLYDEAKKILKVETELKNRLRYIADSVIRKLGIDEKLNISMYNGYLSIYDLVRHVNFEEEFSLMIGKMMNGKETRIMESVKVLEILKANFSVEQANSFHHVYLIIVTQGMTSAKQQFKKDKIMRAKRAFRQHGISLLSDVKKIDNCHSLFPSDFSLEVSSSNKYYQVPVAA